MRNLIDLFQNLTEAVGLSAAEITKYEKRFLTFINKIKSRSPFTTTNGDEVIIDPREASRFEELYATNKFTGAMKARLTTGGEIPLSQLAKTGEFGGAAAAAGQEASSAGKEGLLVKPSTIGITDKNISSADLYEVIKSNPVLNSTDYGKVIIQLAEYITAGESVMIPEEYTKPDKKQVLKAIVDYAGEYLGVLALVYNQSRFPKRADFEKWLGGSTEELTLNFPASANNNLADSFATISNAKTGHTLNISSKGTGGGAAPAISGLKVPDYIRGTPNFEAAAEFIDLCKTKGTLAQAFDAMDLIYKVNPKAIDKKWHPYLPFAVKNPKLEMLSKKSIDDKKNRIETPLPEKYERLYSDIASATASDGGKLVYAIKKEVASAINDREGIPEFKEAILQILEMNFIQQYADYKSGQLTFATQWPAKLDGDISVVNKSSAADPTSGGFSFKLGRTDDSVSSEPGEPEVNGLASAEEFTSAASDIINPKRTEKETGELGGVGRRKR
jgi:hypothetical protein